MRWK